MQEGGGYAATFWGAQAPRPPARAPVVECERWPLGGMRGASSGFAATTCVNAVAAGQTTRRAADQISLGPGSSAAPPAPPSVATVMEHHHNQNQQPKLFCGITAKHGVYFAGVLFATGGLSSLVIGAVFADHMQNNENVKDASILSTMRAIWITVASIGAIQLVVSCIMIIGAVKHKGRLLLPWIIFNALFLILYILGSVNISVNEIKNDTESTGNIIEHFMYRMCTVVAYLVLLYVVRSHYKFLKTKTANVPYKPDNFY